MDERRPTPAAKVLLVLRLLLALAAGFLALLTLVVALEEGPWTCCPGGAATQLGLDPDLVAGVLILVNIGVACAVLLERLWVSCAAVAAAAVLAWALSPEAGSLHAALGVAVSGVLFLSNRVGPPRSVDSSGPEQDKVQLGL